jgi:hypothetical protein
MRKSTAGTARQPHRVVHRTRGRLHRTITCLISLSCLGQILKLSMFLDYLDIGVKA